MNEKEGEEFLKKDVGLVAACFSGSKFEKPKILSGLNETFVPEASVYFKNGLGNLDLIQNGVVVQKLEFNGADQPDINCLDLIYVSFTLPPILALSQSEKAGYCDLPAVNLFKSIKLSIGNASTESFTPLSLDLALREHFKEKYHFLANNWLGGVNGPNQIISACKNFSETSGAQNIIKKSFKCILPLPFHIFRNKNFKVKLNNQPISISLTMDSYATIINHNRLFTVPSNPTITVDFYCQAVTSDESIFNNMPHVTPLANETYIEADESYSVICDNKATLQPDLKINLSSIPTTKYWAQIGSTKLSKKELRFGESTEKAKQNFFAAMLKIKPPNSDIDGLIELNKIAFTKCSTSVNLNPQNHGDFKLEKINEKSFIIKWTTAARQESHELLFTFGIELTCFPDDFCIDLFNYKSTSHLNLKFEYFSMVNFEFEKHNKYNFLHRENVNEIPGLNDVPNYYFSFTTASNVKYVFTEVNSIQKSPHVSQNLIDIAAGMPIVITDQRNPFSLAAWKGHVLFSKPNWPYYDLDGKIPIRVNNTKIGEKTFSSDIIELEKTINDSSQFNLFENFQLSNKLSFKKSNGFFIPTELIEIFLATNDFTFENQDIEPEINKHLMISVIQSCLKHYKYTNGKISYLKSQDYSVLATDVLNEEIGENGRFSDFHVYREIEEEDLTDLLNLSKKKRKVVEDFPKKITNIKQMVHNGTVKNNQIEAVKRNFYR